MMMTQLMARFPVFFLEFPVYVSYIYFLLLFLEFFFGGIYRRKGEFASYYIYR